MSKESHVVGRRQWLSSVGVAAATSALLPQADTQDRGPGAPVEDRGSAISITALTALPAGTKAYLKIDTSHKVNRVGRGYGTRSRGRLRPSPVPSSSSSTARIPPASSTCGRNCTRSHRDMRGGPFMTHVLSAIDMALWDITGKLYGVPVYPPARRTLSADKIRVYTTAKAAKVSAGGPKPFSGTPGEVRGLVERVEEARNAWVPTAP